MNASTRDDNYPESALSSSDLKGLLKAASLTEFRLDDVKSTTTEQFEKSNSLFDLVRSGLSDGAVSNAPVEPKASLDVETVQEDDKVLSDLRLDKHQDAVLAEIISVSKNEDIGSSNPETGAKPENVIDSNIGDEGLKELGDNGGSIGVEDTFEQVTLIDDAQDTSIESRPITESDEFQEEIRQLKLKFDHQLEDEKKIFAKTVEVLFGVSDFIVEEIENQISDFVLTVASDLAGSKIDKLPTPFAKKITRVAKQIVGDEDAVTIHLNTEDFKVINSANIGPDISCKFLEKPTLKRAEFEVSGRKSSAGIALFDITKGK